MNVVDSSGWIEYFLNGPAAERYVPVLKDSQIILTPTIVLYEVYRKVKKESDDEWALSCAQQMEKTQVVPLLPALAYQAADLSLEHKLAMADAIVYATARYHQAKLVTSDSDFKDLPNVVYIPSE